MDWQKDLGFDDVKTSLARSIALSGPIPVCRLFTGHRGIGKTTELKRVKRMLEEGRFGRKLFVSLLEAEQWMDLNDVAPGDIVLHITRQLVDDLKARGLEFSMTTLEQFFKEVGDILRSEVTLKTIKVPASISEFGLVLKEVPMARSVLRMLFQGHLPTIHNLINDVVLKKAREWLRKPSHGQFEDILVIVDELDRIPQKVIKEPDLTNQENIFLDNAQVLKFLQCDVLYTIPIQLAYSRCRELLKNVYSSEILTLPLIPVGRRDRRVFKPGLGALRRIVELRAEKAGASLQQFFAGDGLLDRLCQLSGGHVRNLFILLRSAIERCDRLPITKEVVDRTVRRQAIDISLAIRPQHWKALRKVHKTHKAADQDSDLWYGLLRNLLVFAYEDEAGQWYDWNPLLAEVPGGGT